MEQGGERRYECESVRPLTSRGKIGVALRNERRVPLVRLRVGGKKVAGYFFDKIVDHGRVEVLKMTAHLVLVPGVELGEADPGVVEKLANDSCDAGVPGLEADGGGLSTCEHGCSANHLVALLLHR